MIALAASAMLVTAACTPAVTAAPAPVVIVEPAAEPDLEWRRIADAEDAGRIERVGEAWTEALSEARGSRSAIAEEGDLLRPDAALPRPAPPPGPYHCRVIKLGRQGTGSAFNAYKPFFCYVEAADEVLSIVKQTGSQRPVGRIYPDDREERLVFLGSLALGDEEVPLAYGEQQDRNMAGVVERVAPFRYRLVIPWPRTDSKLDVIELVPVTG